MELPGRTVLVTGAGCRLGRAIAESLGGAGMQVAVHYYSSAEGAAGAVAMIRAGGSRAESFRCDLADPTASTALIDGVVQTFGALDAVINSAAIMLRTPLGEVRPEEWDRMMAINLRAPFFLSQAAAPRLRERRGAIVNIADLAAFESWPAYVPHGISKAGVVQMTRALARALAPDIRVNAVAPGAVLLPEGWPDESGDRLAATTPLRRLGNPADVTLAIRYLLEADFVTGETLIVDGGRHVRA
jgi:pteridine reductase